MTVKRKSFWPRKKPELAAKEFAAALALDPRNLDAQANPGVLLLFQKDYAEAESLLHGVMDRRPDLIKIRALLGMCEQQMRAGLELIEIYAAWGAGESSCSCRDPEAGSISRSSRSLHC